MYLKTLSLAKADDKSRIVSLYSTNDKSDKEIEEVKSLFKKYEIPQLIKLEIGRYTKKSFTNCRDLTINDTNKQLLIDFGTMLMNRKI